jgi:ADP-heptose:LPS heptosyltransferase
MKEWPLGRFRELARRLEQTGAEAVWFWDPGRGDPPGDLPGRVLQGSLVEVAEALASCQVLVAGDSGLAHLGAAVGTQLVVLFGSTAPELGFLPHGRVTVLERDLPCRPCHVHGAARCWLGHGRCLGEISVEEVLGCVRRALEAAPATGR